MNKFFMKDISFLSYFQSALRNILVFTTLSLALIREALVFKNKNLLYNSVYLMFSLVFLLIGILLNYILLNDCKSYKDNTQNSKRSNNVDMDLNILYVMFVIMIGFLFFTLYRMYRNVIKS